MSLKKILIVLIVVVVIVLLFLEEKGRSDSEPRLPKQQLINANQQEKRDLGAAGGAQESQSGGANNSTNQKPMQLEIKTTKEGTGEKAVQAGDTVDVLYTGKLSDGTVFDASANHGNQPFSFKVGAGMVIKGWDQGLLGAKVGEQRTLTIPSDLGYGPQGIPGVIPPNATLIFDVEVIAIK